MIPLFEKNINQNRKVRFSILIPSYNRPQYVTQTIISVLSSSCLNFELIVSDDNSPLIQEIVDGFSNIEINVPFRFYFQQQNLGPSENKNFLVNKAVGEYIILLGDDDLLDSNILNKLELEILQNDGSISIYGFGYNIIDEFNRHVGTFRSFKELYITNKSNTISNIFFEGNILPFYFFHPFTICYKKSLNIKYNSVAHIGYDFLFLFESILKNGTIKVLPIVGFSWRKAQKNGAYQNLSNERKSDLISRVGIYKYFFKNDFVISKLQVKFSKDHICKFIGNTILLEKSELSHNLIYLENELDAVDYDNIVSFLNERLIGYKILFIKIYQCIQLQGFYSFNYFISRAYNMLKFYKNR